MRIYVTRSLPGPPLNVRAHYPYASFALQGNDPLLWTEICTNREDDLINCFWYYFGGFVNGHYSENSYPTASSQGITCVNCTLKLYNVSFAASDGEYTVKVFSGCAQGSQTFDLDVSKCCGKTASPPETYAIKNILLAASDTPRNLTVPNFVFHGCSDPAYFAAKIGFTRESSSTDYTYICSDNITLHGNFECYRQDVLLNCRFFQSLTLIAYTSANSGKFCVQAVSKTEGGRVGTATCFQLGECAYIFGSSYHVQVH